MKLEELLESLEKAAETKAPAETDDTPKVSKELDALLTKEAAADNVKKAFEDGEKLAHAVLESIATKAVEEATKQAEAKQETAPKAEEKTVEKVASTDEKKVEVKADAKTEVEKKAETKVDTKETKEEDMNKQATDAGKELAAAILEKLANITGPSSENTGPAGAVHKIQQDHAKDVAQDDQKVGPTPGRNGTINQLFDAIVAKAKSVSGATGYDQMATGPQAGAESKDQAMGTPAIPPSPDMTDNVKVAQEKQAAVGALIEAGLDWETAVDLVKSAAEEIEAEEFEQVKIAAVNELLKEGMDFDRAVDSVRTAVTELSKETK